MKKQGNNPLNAGLIRPGALFLDNRKDHSRHTLLPEAGRRMLLIHKAGKREFSPNVAAGHFPVYENREVDKVGLFGTLSGNLNNTAYKPIPETCAYSQKVTYVFLHFVPAPS